MGFLENISLHRIAPPELSGTETVADLIDCAFSSCYNAGRLRGLSCLHQKLCNRIARSG
jgi:hypothetical protein